MFDTPFFSVIIPTYNRDNIDVAISSVLNQSFSDFEIIVVDDHSDIPAIERCPILKNERIIYFYLDQNGGAAVARNYGVKEAKGKYIAFIDDDDEWLPQKLKVINDSMGRQSPDLIYHNVVVDMVYEGLRYVPKKKQEEKYYPKMLYINCIGGTPMTIIRRLFFLEIGGFNENLQSDEDGELFIRISKATNNIKYVDNVLSVFYNYTKQTSLTKSIDKRVISRMKIYDMYKEDIECLLTKKERALMWEFMYSDFALASLLNYNRLDACRYYLKTFCVRGNCRYLALTLLSLLSVKLIFFVRTKI